MTACGGTEAPTAEPGKPLAASDGTSDALPEADSSDGGGTAGQDAEGAGGSAEDDEDDSTTEKEGKGDGSTASDPVEGPEKDQRLLTLLSLDAAPDDPGVPLIGRKSLAGMLRATYNADGHTVSTSCNDDLRQEKDGYAVCFVTVDDEPKDEWIGYPVKLSSPEGVQAGDGILWVHDGTPTQQDLDVLGPTHRIVASSGGAHYGTEGSIPVDALGPEALKALKTDPYAPTYSAITCQDDLDTSMFAAVECTAEKKGGGTVTVHVLPAPMQSAGDGLIVSYPTDQVQTG